MMSFRMFAIAMLPDFMFAEIWGRSSVSPS